MARFGSLISNVRASYAIFSAQYPPHLGGIENFTYNLSHSLVKRGHSVLVVTNDTNGVGAGVENDDGVTVLRLPCHPLVDGRFPLPKHNAKNRELKKWLLKQEVEGVLVNARFYPHSLMGMKFARSKGLRPIVLDHGSAWLSFSSFLLDPFVHLYEKGITAWGRRYDPSYYGISSKSAEWLKTFGIMADGVIPNSIDADEYVACSSGRDFRNELGLCESMLVVAFVGRLIPEKGVRQIIEASQSRELVERNVIFVLAGSGPLENEVCAARGSSLRYVGRLTKQDTSALLQSADLMCLPTRSEGFSTTLLEAASCGCPAVVTDVGGARELIPNEAYGTIIKSMDSECIIKNLLFLADDRDRIRKQAVMCSAYVREHCSWAIESELVEKCIQRLSL